MSSYVAVGRQVAVPPAVCPHCRLRLIGWGGYWRWARADQGAEHRLWIRRGRCPGCRRTHALLPSFLLMDRLDVVEVIGIGLDHAASGMGARTIAGQLALPHTTVRDWWRRVRANVPSLLTAVLALATSLDPAPVDLTSDGAAVVLEALDHAWQRASRHLTDHLLDRWAFWSVMSGGRVLSPHTGPPLPG